LTADADSAAVAPARPHMTLPMIGVLLAVTVVWGLNFAIVKTGLGIVPPIAFVALRFAVVGLMLGPGCAGRRRGCATSSSCRSCSASSISA
jgi:drug/metabolite transporter (DMT)-like permease